MTTWYSYYRNFHSPFSSSSPSTFYGGYNLNAFLTSGDDSDMIADDSVKTFLQNLEKVMIGEKKSEEVLKNDAYTFYQKFVREQLAEKGGDERLRMINDWQKYNRDEGIRKYPWITAIALAMLFISDGWRIQGGKINARKYRRFIRGYLRRLPKDDPMKIAYTAIAKIMHNPLNAGDDVVERIEKERQDNEIESWGKVYAPRLLKLGIPKLKSSEYYSLSEAAADPRLSVRLRVVKRERDSDVDR